MAYLSTHPRDSVLDPQCSPPFNPIEAAPVQSRNISLCYQQDESHHVSPFQCEISCSTERLECKPEQHNEHEYSRNSGSSSESISHCSPSTLDNSDRTSKSPPARSKKEKKLKADGQKKARLTKPLSILTKHMSIPVRDIEAWVHRSIEERLLESRDGHIKRPMNSFMLYRSAYAERIKKCYSQNNHQVVSSISGESWPLEPREIRDMFDTWAKIERSNHQIAHPNYKFSPSKNLHKRKDADANRNDISPPPTLHAELMNGDYYHAGDSARMHERAYDSFPFRRQYHPAGLQMDIGLTLAQSVPMSATSSQQHCISPPHSGDYLRMPQMLPSSNEWFSSGDGRVSAPVHYREQTFTVNAPLRDHMIGNSMLQDDARDRTQARTRFDLDYGYSHDMQPQLSNTSSFSHRAMHVASLPPMTQSYDYTQPPMPVDPALGAGFGATPSSGAHQQSRLMDEYLDEAFAGPPLTTCAGFQESQYYTDTKPSSSKATHPPAWVAE